MTAPVPRKPLTPPAVGAAQVIGVVGAGTMGSAIAALACRARARTMLYDPAPDALGEGIRRAHEHLKRLGAREGLSAQQSRAAALLQPVDELADLRDCELIIEAAPERIKLKHELYAHLSELVDPECVLATNTSSLPVTAIAAGARHPARVVGMHFFTPHR